MGLTTGSSEDLFDDMLPELLEKTSRRHAVTSSSRLAASGASFEADDMVSIVDHELSVSYVGGALFCFPVVGAK